MTGRGNLPDMKTLPIQTNGHQLFSRRCEKAEMEVWTFTLDDGTETVRWSDLPDRCGLCGEWLNYRVTDGHVHPESPCTLPDGITTEITLEVPSGKLIVADSLRPVYDWNDDELTHGYNYAAGQAEAIKVMAGKGCAFGPVGNTCPGLYRTAHGKYVIACLEYDEETDDTVMPDGWESLAGICTDLWAYSIADLEHWQASGGVLEDRGWGTTVVNVVPGVYKFTHHTGERDFDRDVPGTVVFADIELVKD